MTLSTLTESAAQETVSQNAPTDLQPVSTLHGANLVTSIAQRPGCGPACANVGQLRWSLEQWIRC